jgi:hypothetical protein
MADNVAGFATARRHVRVDGVATECGMARGDPLYNAKGELGNDC